MPIRFYSTKVDASQTASEIQEILAEAGATHVRTSYNPQEGGVDSIEFTLEIEAEQVGFRLSPDVEGMQRALKEDEGVPPSKETIEHAEKVAWRNLKAWLESQLAFRAANQASLDQLLLGYGITRTGETMYHRLVEDKKLLEA